MAMVLVDFPIIHGTGQNTKQHQQTTQIYCIWGGIDGHLAESGIERAKCYFRKFRNRSTDTPDLTCELFFTRYSRERESEYITAWERIYMSQRQGVESE